MRVLYRGTGHIRIQSKKAATHIDLLLAPEHLCSQPCALAIRLHKHKRAGLTVTTAIFQMHNPRVHTETQIKAAERRS